MLHHTLRIDASKVPAVDGDSIPTGPFIDIRGNVLDFRTAQEIGARINDTFGVCGVGAPYVFFSSPPSALSHTTLTVGCTGYDNNWIYDRDVRKRAGLALWSASSGIRLDVTTNQPAVQVYTGNFLATPRKAVHGGPSLNYTKWSAVAIEQMGYLDAINTPEWHENQICELGVFFCLPAPDAAVRYLDEPGKDFEWWATYKFSTVY